MLLPGREWQEGYRFGFNGKECADDIFGEDNTIDFGSRIYIPRLGRWMSIDVRTSEQPSWSPYKSFKDSPICIIDPNGETEYMVTEIVDANTGKSFFQIEVLNPDNLMSEVTSKRGTIDPHDTHKVMGYYDIVHHTTVTIGNDGVKVEYPNDTYGLRYTRSYWSMFRAIGNFMRKDLGGEGGMQAGGFMFTSAKGGIDPTKYLASNPVDILNVDDFLKPMQALSSSMSIMNWATEPPNLKDVQSQVKLVNYAKKIAQQYINANPNMDVSEVQKWLAGLPSGETVEICSYCYDVLGKQVIAEDHGHEMWPVPIEWYNNHSIVQPSDDNSGNQNKKTPGQ